MSGPDRERALQSVRARCLLTRRIVPFLVHEWHARGNPPSEIAARLGVRVEDVRAWVEEIEGELRAVLAGEYTPGGTTPTRHE